jgi:hypothetical protein
MPAKFFLHILPFLDVSASLKAPEVFTISPAFETRNDVIFDYIRNIYFTVLRKFSGFLKSFTRTDTLAFARFFETDSALMIFFEFFENYASAFLSQSFFDGMNPRKNMKKHKREENCPRINTDSHRFFLFISYLCLSVFICGQFFFFLFVIFRG